jgi:hypothetical protein
MKSSLRHGLARSIALTIYVAIYVFAPAIHHHHTAEARPSQSALASDIGPLLKGSASDDSDDEDEGHCSLCSVLSLAQVTPTLLQTEAIPLAPAKALFAVAIGRPFPITATTHSRAPPV